jgi:hypothetical protein
MILLVIISGIMFMAGATTLVALVVFLTLEGRNEE